MGCGTIHFKPHKIQFHQDLIKKIDSFRPANNNEEDEAEVQIVNEGKIMEKSQLDEITDKNISILKIVDNEITFENSTKRSPRTDRDIDDIQDGLSENKKELNEMKNNIQGVKIEFENIPPDFDFSYLEAKSEPNEQDLLNEKVLKEVLEYRL